MAIVVNNHQVTRSVANLDSYSLSSYAVPSGTNRVLVVIVSILRSNESGVGVTGVTFGGAALTAAGVAAEGTSTSRSYYTRIWYLVNPSVSTANIVVSLSTTHAGAIISAMTLTGVDQTTPVASYAYGSKTNNYIDFGSDTEITWVGGAAELYIYGVSANSASTPTWAWDDGTATAVELYDLNNGTSDNNEIAGSAAYSSYAIEIAECSTSPARTVGVAVGFTEAAPTVIDATAADLLEISEGREGRGLYRPAAVDALDIDTGTATRRALRAIATETVDLAGGIGRRADYAVSLDDLLEIVLAAGGGYRYGLSASDALAAGDAPVVGFRIVQTAADSWTLAPAIARRVDFSAAAADAVETTDGGTYPLPAEQGDFTLTAYEDSLQGADGLVHLSNNQIAIMNGNPYGAIEFHDVDVPRGATPVAFHLRLYVADRDDPGLTIRLQKDATPATLAGGNNDISGRTPFTDAGIEWSGANIGQNTHHNSPDLSAAFEELFAMPEWERGGNVVVVLNNNGTGGQLNFATTEDGNSARRPQLIGEWYLGGLTISAVAADALALSTMVGRRSLIELAIADTANLAAAATTTLALLVSDAAGLSDTLSALSRFTVGDSALLSGAVGLAHAVSLSDTASLAETLARMAALQAGAVDAMTHIATARTRIGTAAGDALGLADALVARNLLVAALFDGARFTHVAEGDMAGIFEGMALDGWAMGAAAWSGWTTGATAIDAADITDSLAAARRFLAAVTSAGRFSEIAAAAYRARAAGLDTAAFGDALRADWRTFAADGMSLSDAAADRLAVILYALAADVAALGETTSTVWRIEARDTAEFVTSVAAIMRWSEAVQDALGITGVSAFVNPAGVVTIQIRINQTAIAFEIAMPSAATRLVAPSIEMDLKSVD